jgi:chromate transport protein ChrA
MRNRRAANPPEPEEGFFDTTIPTDIVKTNPEAEQIGADSGPAFVSTAQASEETSQKMVQPFHDAPAHAIPVKIALLIIGLFFTTFTILMTLRGVLHHLPLIFRLFNNMFLAGTIVFGGGSVIIALLRDYVVQPGWVSPRNFLIGLAVIQALPGPNSNFGVYLGALVVVGPASTLSIPTIFGGIVAFIGIFSPCLWLAVGFRGLWQSWRKNRVIKSVLRGINATAVGFVFAAVYRLWQTGYLSAAQSKGGSLGQQPCFVAVAATTFTAVEWFSVPPPVAILSGGVAGLGWWGAVARHHH